MDTDRIQEVLDGLIADGLIEKRYVEGDPEPRYYPTRIGRLAGSMLAPEHSN